MNLSTIIQKTILVNLSVKFQKAVVAKFVTTAFSFSFSYPIETK